jgi:hypothetical protein
MMKNTFPYITMLVFTIILTSCRQKTEQCVVSGDLKKWHKVTLTVTGPSVHELDTPSPFLDYRLTVNFKHENREYLLPGFYSADGNAAHSGASKGDKWQVRFVPDQEGRWEYVVSFRKGKNIAISDDPDAGEPAGCDGCKGAFFIGSTDKAGPDLRAKGKLRYVGERYLQFAETGEYFLKGGVDSPENFLAYIDFDDTYLVGDEVKRDGEAVPDKNLHQYPNHLKDWNPGDPTWQNNKGKSIIGALNYLASKGMNSVYFLTMNIQGDGNDVWPYTSPDERYRFDCSKLDQWEIVFSHMDKLGIMLHIVTQETENEILLDNGDTGIQRKLYYRELIARFSHHLAVTWNMGEENGRADFTSGGQSVEQQKAMTRYMKEHDPYENFVVIHTHSNPVYRYRIFDQLTGYAYLDGPSMQVGNLMNAHEETLVWLEKSSIAGRQWVVNIDEIGPASRGVDPDDRQPNNQDIVRRYVLWANLMAGGGGVEWYFGYENHDNDLNCEDWRSRDQLWDQTRIALEFFRNHLPFRSMVSLDTLTTSPEDYCLTKPGFIYAIYLPDGGTTSLDLSCMSGRFSVKWFNPRSGGGLIRGLVSEIEGGGWVSVGKPPEDVENDWAVLVEKTNQ